MNHNTHWNGFTGRGKTHVLYQGLYRLREKPISVEGDGLQAVHNYLEMNSALAAEG
jgi:hypothetical protein